MRINRDIFTGIVLKDNRIMIIELTGKKREQEHTSKNMMDMDKIVTNIRMWRSLPACAVKPAVQVVVHVFFFAVVVVVLLAYCLVWWLWGFRWTTRHTNSHMVVKIIPTTVKSMVLD